MREREREGGRERERGRERASKSTYSNTLQMYHNTCTYTLQHVKHQYSVSHLISWHKQYDINQDPLYI